METICFIPGVVQLNPSCPHLFKENLVNCKLNVIMVMATTFMLGG